MIQRMLCSHSQSLILAAVLAFPLSTLITSCSGPNHGALCDKALDEAQVASRNKDYKRAAALLNVASKEADLFDSATEKRQVFRDQIALCNTQNDFVGAEQYARQMISFEQKQEHAENTTAWRIAWAEHIVDAEISLADALKAQGNKKEALEVYKKAIEKIKECNAPTEIEARVSERYVDTLRALGTATGPLITDPSAIAMAVEDYNDSREEMYDLRSHKQWAELITSAKKVAIAAAQCKQIDAGVSAYNCAAAAEYFLGNNTKAQEFAKLGINLAKAHPLDGGANESAADGWITLAITDDDPAQARKDADMAYKVHSGHAETERRFYLENIDAAKWEQLFDLINELRIPELRRMPMNMRVAIWQDWVRENQNKHRVKKGLAWLDKMSKMKRLIPQDIADSNDGLLKMRKHLSEISPQEWRSRIAKNVQIREGMRKQSPDDQWNSAFLVVDYNALGQFDKALALATATQKVVDRRDVLYEWLSEHIATIKQNKSERH